MHRLRLPLVALLLSLSACMTGEYIMVYPIAGGGKVQVPLSGGGPQLVDNDDLHVLVCTFTVPPAKEEMVYLFDVIFKKGIPPKRVVVDDVSEDPVKPLVDDKDPKFAANAGFQWRQTHEYKPTSPDQVPWLSYEGNAMRIYRFTVTYADGRTEVYYQPVPVPAFVKDYLKERLGFEKKPAPASN